MKRYRLSNGFVGDVCEMVAAKQVVGKFTRMEDSLTYNRRRFNNMTGAEQDEWERRAKVQKRTYNLRLNESGHVFFRCTKAEFMAANVPEYNSASVYD